MKKILLILLASVCGLAAQSTVFEYPDGLTVRFNPNATRVGIEVGQYAGNPSAPVNSGLWYNSSTNALMARINGANVDIGSAGLTGPGSSTNLAIATYSGTGGMTLLNNPAVTINSGVLTATGFAGPLTGAVTGNASTATALANARTINGTSFDGTGNITVTAAAGTLTGTALNGTVVTSGLTSLGTVGTGLWQGTAVGSAYGGTGLDNSAATGFGKWTAGTYSVEAAGTHRTSIGGTTAGQNLFTVTNPSAITFLRVNADNTVDTLSASAFRTAIGAGTGTGTGDVIGPGASTANGLASWSGTGGFTLLDNSATISGGIITATGFVGPLTGNVTGNVSGTAPAGTLTGATLAAGVTGSSLTSLGTQASNLLFTDNTLDIGASAATRPRTGYFGTSVFSPRYDVATSVGWRSGTGTPEGAITANIGSLFSRTDGTTNTALYRKETGTGNTGWVASAAGGTPGGSDTYVQLNNGGALGGVSGLVANTTTGALTQTLTTLGTSTAASVTLSNSTAAAAAAQQVSPALTLQGNGWKTTATAASQTMAFRLYTLPVQGTAAPSGTLVLNPVINGTPGTDTMTITSAGVITLASAGGRIITGQGSDTSPAVSVSGGHGFFYDGSDAMGLSITSVGRWKWRGTDYFPTSDGLGNIGYDSTAGSRFAPANIYAATAMYTATYGGYRSSSASDAVGNDVMIQPGTSRGTGAPKAIILKTGTVGVSGSTIQTQNARLTVETTGLTATVPIIFTPQALSGAGAVDVITGSTALTTTGAAQALTLANGTSGQIKTICHVVDGGSAILTPTTASGWTTCTFTGVGESLTLQYHTTAGWIVIGSYLAVVAP